MKRPEGVTAIAIWFFVAAILTLIFACMMVAIPISGAIDSINDPVGEFWAIFSLTCGVIFIFVAGILSVIAGWGLLRMKQWARWLSLVLGIFTLFAFPIGTVIGAFIIWYLLKQDVREAFEMAEGGILTEQAEIAEAE